MMKSWRIKKDIGFFAGEEYRSDKYGMSIQLSIRQLFDLFKMI